MNPKTHKFMPALKCLLSLIVAVALTGSVYAQRDSTFVLPDGRSVVLTVPTVPTEFSVGKRPPTLMGADLRGNLSSAPRRRAVYFYSFIGCKPCKSVMDHLERRGWALRDNLRFVYINPQDTPEMIQEVVVDEYQSGAFRVLRLDRKTKEAFRVQAFPLSIVVDARGRIEAVHEGYDEEWVDGLLDNP